MKARYCGTSPYGNGPADGCEPKYPKTQPGVNVIAHFECKWGDTDRICTQFGQPPDDLRSTLTGELHKLGLTPVLDKRLQFAVFESAGWIVAEATYSRFTENALTFGQVIMMLDPDRVPYVVHHVRFQKADYDRGVAAEWHVIGLADANANGKPYAILEGYAYENQWFEAHAIRDDKPKLIFSGLGYYL